MAFVVEMVVDGDVDGSELLECLHSAKPQHRPLSSSERQVAVLHPVVLPSAHLAAVEIAQLAHRGRVGSEPVGDYGPRSAVAFQSFLQKLQSRWFIALFRHKGFQDLTLVINRAPQIMSLAVDPDEHLVEVPAPVMKPTHPFHLLASDVGREHWSEAVPCVDGSLLQEVEQIILIGLLASICTAFGCDHI
jgi:hypothetical protein